MLIKQVPHTVHIIFIMLECRRVNVAQTKQNKENILHLVAFAAIGGYILFVFFYYSLGASWHIDIWLVLPNMITFQKVAELHHVTKSFLWQNANVSPLFWCIRIFKFKQLLMMQLCRSYSFPHAQNSGERDVAFYNPMHHLLFLVNFRFRCLFD